MDFEDRKILAAAVLYNGKIYQGLRHADIMRIIWAEEKLPQVKITQDMQGFVCNEGKFWNRFQAGSIAFGAGQTKTRKNHLLSEDVW